MCACACAYLPGPGPFHQLEVVFVLQVPVQLPLGAVDKLTDGTLYTT